MQRLALSIRRWQGTPNQWQHSMSFQLDKQNNKPGCQGIRLVSCLDPCGAAYYKHLWRRCRPCSHRPYAAGYCRQKSRLEPICQQNVVSHRLRSRKVSHACSFLMFKMRSALDSVARLEDRQLWEQRYREALVRVSDGRAEADFRPRSGTMQGDGPSAELFLEPYHPQLDKWAQATAINDPRIFLVAKCVFLCGEAEQDLSLSSVADDVGRISLGTTPEDLRLSLEAANAGLDRYLWDIGLVQNVDKQEHVLFFGGKNSAEYLRSVYGASLLPGRTVPSARYLGAQVQYSGKIHTEIDKRLQIAKRNWAKMGPFLFRSFSSKRGKILVYVALVHSALVSGLEFQVLGAGKYQQLSSLVLKHGRKLMQGKACSKQVMPDATIKYISCTSKAVWRWLGLCPVDLELQIRRLVWYQQLAKDVQKHICVLMAIFGRLGCETCDTADAAGRILQTANPWAKQFLANIQCLQKIDAGQALLDLLGDRVLLVFTDFLPEFLAIDMSELRRTFDPICIPPPGWVEPESPIAAVESTSFFDIAGFGSTQKFRQRWLTWRHFPDCLVGYH